MYVRIGVHVRIPAKISIADNQPVPLFQGSYQGTVYPLKLGFTSPQPVVHCTHQLTNPATLHYKDEDT